MISRNNFSKHKRILTFSFFVCLFVCFAFVSLRQCARANRHTEDTLITSATRCTGANSLHFNYVLHIYNGILATAYGEGVYMPDTCTVFSTINQCNKLYRIANTRRTKSANSAALQRSETILSEIFHYLRLQCHSSVASWPPCSNLE